MSKDRDMESSSHVSIRTLLRHPLAIVRILLIPAVAIAVISYPLLLLVGAMASDSGTHKAVAISTMALILFTVYTGSVILAFVKWSRWRRLSPVLLLFYAACNIAATITIPDVVAVLALYPIASVRQTDINSLPEVIGVIPFAVFCIGIPALGALTIRRHTKPQTDTEPSTG